MQITFDVNATSRKRAQKGQPKPLLVGSIGLQFENDGYHFLGAVNRLMNGAAKFNGFGADVFFDLGHNIFELASQVVVDHSLAPDQFFIIDFKDGRPIVSVFKVEEGNKTESKRFDLDPSSALYKDLEGKAEVFRGLIETVGKWCEREMLEFGEKDRSLSEVFGL